MVMVGSAKYTHACMKFCIFPESPKLEATLTKLRRAKPETSEQNIHFWHSIPIILTQGSSGFKRPVNKRRICREKPTQKELATRRFKTLLNDL